MLSSTHSSNQQPANALGALGVSVQELIGLKMQSKKIHLGLSNRVRSVLAGNHTSKFRGRGMDFAESRRYQNGDDARHIDWRVTARTQQPHSKLYIEERERPVFILVDFSPTMFFGSKPCLKTVTACRLAALLAWAGATRGDRIGGIVAHDQGFADLKPKPGNRGVLRLATALADASVRWPDFTQPQATSPLTSGNALNRALSHGLRVSHPGSLVIIISDFFAFNDDCVGQFHQLARHNDLMLFEISDPLEHIAPPAGRYGISDGRTKVLLDTRIKGSRAQFGLRYSQKHQAIHQLARRNNLSLMEINNGDDLVQVLSERFTRRSVARTPKTGS